MSKHGEISRSRLLEVFEYDKDTGIFTWKIDRTKHAKAGCIAGASTWSGYISLQVDGVKMLAHRAAMVICGFDVSGPVDHINGSRSDNRISNLRIVTTAENNQNRNSAKGKTKSGKLGVSWRSRQGKWRATIVVNGKFKELGVYATVEEASQAYLSAKAILHPAWAPVPKKETA